MCEKQSHHQSQVSHGLVWFVPGAGVYSYLSNKGSGPLVFLLPRFPVHGNSCPFWDQHLSLISSRHKGLCSINPSAVCVCVEHFAFTVQSWRTPQKADKSRVKPLLQAGLKQNFKNHEVFPSFPSWFIFVFLFFCGGRGGCGEDFSLNTNTEILNSVV